MGNPERYETLVSLDFEKMFGERGVGVAAALGVGAVAGAALTYAWLSSRHRQQLEEAQKTLSLNPLFGMHDSNSRVDLASMSGAL
jgi:hypothetical protein